MRIFISGEISQDIQMPFIYAASEVADKLNRTISCREYGGSVKTWYFLPIVFDKPIPGFTEETTVNKEKKYVECRPYMAHSAFATASSEQQRSLLFGSLLRSIQEVATLDIEGFDRQQFEQDIRDFGEQEGWL
jgi:hypothetical protein